MFPTMFPSPILFANKLLLLISLAIGGLAAFLLSPPAVADVDCTIGIVGWDYNGPQLPKNANLIANLGSGLVSDPLPANLDLLPK